jgi:hypothetical protein
MNLYEEAAKRPLARSIRKLPGGEVEVEFEVVRDGCIQFTAPTLAEANAFAEAEGAWAFKLYRVERIVVKPEDSDEITMPRWLMKEPPGNEAEKSSAPSSGGSENPGA